LTVAASRAKGEAVLRLLAKRGFEISKPFGRGGLSASRLAKRLSTGFIIAPLKTALRAHIYLMRIT